MFVHLDLEVYCLRPTLGECCEWALEVTECMIEGPFTWLVWGLDAVHWFG